MQSSQSSIISTILIKQPTSNNPPKYGIEPIKIIDQQFLYISCIIVPKKKDNQNNMQFKATLPLFQLTILQSQFGQDLEIEKRVRSDMAAKNGRFIETISFKNKNTLRIIQDLQSIKNKQMKNTRLPWLGYYNEKQVPPLLFWPNHTPQQTSQTIQRLNQRQLQYRPLYDGLLIQNTNQLQNQRQRHQQWLNSSKIIQLSRYIRIILQQNNDNVNQGKILREILAKDIASKYSVQYVKMQSIVEMRFILEMNCQADVLRVRMEAMKENANVQYLAEGDVEKSKLIRLKEEDDDEKQGKGGQNAHFINALKDKIKYYCKKIASQDYTYLMIDYNTQQHTFQNFLQHIIQKWDILQPFIQHKIQYLIDVIKVHLYSMNSLQVIYPKLKPLINKLQKLCEYKDRQKCQEKPQKITNMLYHYFYDELTQRTAKQASFFIRDERTNIRMAVGEFIAQCREYKLNPNAAQRWQQIFSRISHNKRIIDEQKIKEQSYRKQKQLRNDFVNNLAEERLMALQCLGCCEFFYANMNIKDTSINQTHLITLPSARKIKQCQNLIKDQICWLLNNNGGVILFDCDQRYRQVYTRGQYFSQNQQSQTQQKIYNYVRSIYPTPDVTRNVQVTFVPIIKNPFLFDRLNQIQTNTETTYKHTFFLREYIEGLYITRIKVNPTAGDKLYFYLAENKLIAIQKKNGQSKQYSSRQMTKLFKKRFNTYYLNQNDPNYQENLLLAEPVSNFHAGDCRKPEKGILVTQRRKAEQNNLSNEQKYTYLSLLIAKRANFQDIKKKLIKKIGECQIEPKYLSHKFKAAINSACLYHNIRFDLLLNEVAYNKQYEYDVTQFVKLVSRSVYNILPQDDFQTFKKWLKLQHPNQVLRMWRFYTDNQDYQYYLETDGRCSTVFIYYVLNHYGEKCIFKNPKNYDKFGDQDKKQRMKLLYPRTSYSNSNGIGMTLESSTEKIPKTQNEQTSQIQDYQDYEDNSLLQNAIKIKKQRQ